MVLQFVGEYVAAFFLESLFNRTGFLVFKLIGAVTAFVSPPFFIKLQSDTSVANWRSKRLEFFCLQVRRVNKLGSPPCYCQEERRSNLISTINANALTISPRVRDGSENPLRSKEVAYSPTRRGTHKKI